MKNFQPHTHMQLDSEPGSGSVHVRADHGTCYPQNMSLWLRNDKV